MRRGAIFTMAACMCWFGISKDDKWVKILEHPFKHASMGVLCVMSLSIGSRVVSNGPMYGILSEPIYRLCLTRPRERLRWLQTYDLAAAISEVHV